MTSATYTNRFAFEPGAGYSTVVSVASTPHRPSPTDTETRSAYSRLSRFSAFAAPMAVVAAMFWPSAPAWVTRIDSSGEGSQSLVHAFKWDMSADPWTYTTARTTQAEIDALNQLFAISSPAGFSIDLADA